MDQLRSTMDLFSGFDFFHFLVLVQDHTNISTMDLFSGFDLFHPIYLTIFIFLYSFSCVGPRSYKHIYSPSGSSSDLGFIDWGVLILLMPFLVLQLLNFIVSQLVFYFYCFKGSSEYLPPLLDK